MDIGQHLKRIRLVNGLSAQRMSDYIGVNVARLRKWESVGVSPKEGDRQLIADYFKLNIDDLEDLIKIEKFKFYSKNKVELVKDLKHEINHKKDDNSTISDLAKSIVILSDMGKTLADSNRDVVIMLKESKANFRSEDMGLEAAPSEMLKGFVQMAKALVRKGHYQSYEEATDYLSTLLVSEQEEKLFLGKKKRQGIEDKQHKQT